MSLLALTDNSFDLTADTQIIKTLPRTYMQMFFRKDAFRANNITLAPQTWDEVLSVLKFLNGELKD